MTSFKIIAVALSLFGAFAAPARATPITYDVSIPLIADGSGSTVATDSLFGQLTYDDDLWTGSGTFTIASLAGETLVSQFFSGWSILMDAGDGGLGVFFDAMQDDGTGLYFNISTGTTADTLSLIHI
ncbi:hypothetical protein P7D22_17810 [Lichenihabitans sp. Uapishka_5]|nr:hypothetical protein [Lichenihabitans sp. Uapishka_5]MDX7953020.1 hypothetical protein [Lichenihabitans sp. Uapishka_5]